MPFREKSTAKEDVADAIVGALTTHRILAYSELAKHGATSAILKNLVNEGLIVVLGSGLYASAQLDPFIAAVLATAMHYPHAVISGNTALQIHCLGDEYVDKVDVDISRDTSIRNRMLDVHRVPNGRLVGIVSMLFHGGKIRVYDLERTLCEAYLIDADGPTFFKALKRYRAMGKIAADVIARYDEALKTRVLAHLRQELADA